MTITHFSSAASDVFNSFVGVGEKFIKQCGLGTQTFFKHLGNIKDDSTAHAHFWKIIPSAITALSSTDLGLLQSRPGRAVVVLEGLQIIGDISDFMSGKLSKSSWKEIAGRVCFAFSNLGTTVLWATELGALSLNSGVLKSFTLMSAGGAIAGFGLGAASAIYNLANAKNHKYSQQVTVKAVLDLIACTSGAALPILSLMGVAVAPLPIALLVIASSGCGILSFCYEKEHPEAFDESKIKDSKEVKGFWRFCSDFVNKTEGLDKVAKLFTTLAEGAENAVVVALSYDLKCFAEFNTLLALPKRIQEWIVPVKGKYFWETNSPLKIAHKVFITALSVVSTTTFIIRYKIAELAPIAGATIGGVSVLALASPLCIAAFSTCSLIENSLALKDEYQGNGKLKLNKSEEKLKHWLKLSKHLQDKDVHGTVQKKLDHCVKKLRDKGAALRIDGNLEDALEVEFQSNLLKDLYLHEFVERKIRRLEARHDNACLRCNKCAINILNDFGKIVGTSLICTSMIVGAAGAAAAAPISVAAATFGLASAFLGIYKFGWDGTHKEKAESKVYALA